MILMKAAKISRQFCEKSWEAQISCVRCFVKAQGLVHHLGTHESQKASEETQTEALDLWMSYVQSFNCNVIARLLF